MQFCLQNVDGHFSLQPLTQIGDAAEFTSALWLSTELAIVTMVIVMVLMVPTMIYVHLRMPRFRRVMEVITILPIVIPPIVLIVGVDGVTPSWLKASQWLLALVYVVLAMPYVYRALDAGLGALDLKTLVEASRSLGSGWTNTIVRVLVPNLRAPPVGLRAHAGTGLRGVHDRESRRMADRARVDLPRADRQSAH